MLMRQAGAVPLVVLGVAAGKRARLMQAACAGQGLPPARLLEWREWLQVPELLARHLDAPCRLKIEPPGDDEEVHHRLLQAGCARMQRQAPERPAHGELLAADAWFTGFSEALHRLAALLQHRSHVQVMNAPSDILVMTDKLLCQQRLQQHQVPTPPLLGPVQGYDHLRALLDQHGLDRVYLKARYGSSAAGVLAYRRTRQGQEQATTSAQLVEGPRGTRLFNVKRLRSYGRAPDIRRVIDLIAGQQAYAEAWIPKPRSGAGHFDVRLVTLAGRPAHRVARIGDRAMTNLHLDSRRAEVGSLLSAADVRALEATACQAAGAFPHSRMIGFDVVVRHGKAQVLEANAFGDLLPGLLWQGQDTYAAGLCAMGY